jgi:hypothetical protein
VSDPIYLKSPFQDLIDPPAKPKSLPGSEAVKEVDTPDLSAAPAPEPSQPAQAKRAPASPASLLPPPDQRPMFEGVASHFGVPVNVLMAVVQQESSYNPDAVNKETGAAGVGQYMDATAKSLRINPKDPNEAVPAIAQQIRERLDKGYSMEDAVKEHFAGPDRKKWGEKTAAYGQEVLGKAGVIGKELYGDAPNAVPEAPAAPQAGPEQNQFAPSRMDRATYEKKFRALNPKASDGAIKVAMDAYDKQATAKTKAATSRVQDKFKQLQSPEAMFDARLNERLQGPQDGVMPQLPGREQPTAFPDTTTKHRPGVVDQAKGDFGRGIDNLRALGYGAAGLAADEVGKDDASTKFLDQYVAIQNDIAKNNPATIGTYKNVKSMGDAGRYAIEAVMENLPMILPSLVTGGVGAKVAQAGAQRLVTGMIESQVAKGVAREVAEKNAAQFIARRVMMGSAAGAAPATIGMESGSIMGDIYQDTGQKRSGLAIGFGIPAGLLDTLEPVMALRKIAGPAADEVAGGIIKRLGVEAGKQFITEAGTEGLQTVLEEAAKAKAANKNLMTPQLLDAVIDSALKGGIGGAGMGVVSQGIADARGALPGRPLAPSAPPQLGEQAQKNQQVTEQGGRPLAPVNAAAPAQADASVADQLRAIRPPDAPTFTATDEGFSGQIMGDDGQLHAIDSRTGVTMAEPPAGPLESALHEAAAQHAADPTPAPVMPEPAPAPPDYTAMPLDQLQAELKAVASRPQATSDERLAVRADRKMIEQEIGARAKQAKADSKPAEEPLKAGPFEDMKQANTMMLRYAEQTGKPHEVVGTLGHFVIQPIGGKPYGIDPAGTERGPDGHGRSGNPASVMGSADGAASGEAGRGTDGAGRGGQPEPVAAGSDDAGTDRAGADGTTHAQPALIDRKKDPYHAYAFANPERAEGFMDAKKVDREKFEVVQTGKVRWQVKPRAVQAQTTIKGEAPAVQHLQKTIGAPVRVESVDENFGTGTSFVIQHPDTTVQMAVREDDKNIYVINIHAKDPADLTKQVRGTGRGREAMEALKTYADQTGKRLAVVGVTDGGKNFWSKLAWLKHEPIEMEFQGQKHLDESARIYDPKQSTKETAADVSQRQEVPEEAPVARGEKSAQQADNGAVQVADAGAPAVPTKPKRELTNAEPEKPKTRDTRNTGVRFHGTSRPLPDSGPNNEYAMSGDNRNIYGQGFYTTDAADISEGYMRKGRGGSPTLYEIKEKGEPKLYDMEQQMTPEVRKMAERVMGDEFPEQDIDGKPINTLRDLFDEYRNESKSNGLTRDEVQEVFDSIRYNLEQDGYHGYRHIGGLKTNKSPHDVRIYWTPEDHLSVEKSDLSKYQGEENPQPAVVEQAPAPTEAPEQREFFVQGHHAGKPDRSASITIKADDRTHALEKARSENSWFVPKEAREVEKAAPVKQEAPAKPKRKKAAPKAEKTAEVKHSVAAHPMAPDAAAVDPLIQLLADKGAIVLHDDASTLPGGKAPSGTQALTEKDGTIHLVKGASNAVLLHEAFHSGGQSLVGSKVWGDLMQRLASLYRQGESTSGAARAFWDAARERVETAKAKGAVAPGMEHEEFGAYAIEEYESAPATIRKWVDDLAGAVKAWALRRFGKQLGQVTPAQLSALAKAALLDVAHSRAQEASGEAAPAYSSNADKTIEVDGVSRPIENSKGKLIAEDMHKQMNFWRWFKDSAVVDEQGRPRVIYHGTNVDFTQFEDDKVGSSWDAGKLGKGFYFSTDRRLASSYGTNARAKTREDAPHVMPVYASIQNPLEIGPLDWKNGENLWDKLRDFSEQAGITVDPVSDPDSNQPNPAWSEPFRDALKKFGYDGVLLNFSDGHREVVAFDPTQIKSAVGNDGSFAVANPDIRYSVAGSPQPRVLTPNEQGLLRRVQGQVQDNLNRVKQVQERISKLTGVNDLAGADYYGAETNRPGRIAARKEDGRDKLFEPMLRRLADAGYKPEQLEELLHAQHAEERNEAVAKINPEFPDGGSGMTTAEANRIIARYQGEAKLLAIADEARQIARETLDMKKAYGLITDAQHDDLSIAYDNYVPLKGDGEYGPKQKRAMGHAERDEHILENIARDFEQAIVVGEKNLARQSLLQMVLQYPDDGLWTARAPAKGRYVAGTVFEISPVGTRNVEASFTSQAQVSAWLEAKGAAAAGYEVNTSGGERVVEFTKPLQDNEVMVYVKGSPVRIQIQDEKLALQLRPLRSEMMNTVLQLMQKHNRYLSMIFTGYNPAFIMKNATRDAITGTINMAGNHGAVTAAKAWAKYPAAWATMLKWAATKKDQGGAMGQHLKEYRAQGGKIGASYMSDLEEQGKTLARMFDDAKGAIAYAGEGRVDKAAIIATRKAIGGMAHVVEVVNQAFENALRLALYAQLREEGHKPGIAAQAAKNVTVNFDRKGTATPYLGALYLFINPAIQGTANLTKTLAKGEHKYQAWALTGMMAAAGFAAALHGMDDDKDRWLGDKWDLRTKNLRYHMGKHTINVPLSQEYAPFYALGVAMGEVSRGESSLRASVNVLSSFLDAYYPFQGAVQPGSDNYAMDLLLAHVPTVGKLGAQIAANRNSFGNKIVPETDNTKNRPDNLKMYRGTKNSGYDAAAQGLAKAGQALGADKYANDLSKVSPETLKLIYATYTGGLGRFIADSAGFGAAKLRGDEGLDTGDVPIVKDFVKADSMFPLRTRYFDLAKDAQEAIDQFTVAKKQKDADEMRAIVADPSKKAVLGLSKMIANTNKIEGIYADMAVDINADKSLSLGDKRARLKALEDKQEEIYRKAIGAFRK